MTASSQITHAEELILHTYVDAVPNKLGKAE